MKVMILKEEVINLVEAKMKSIIEAEVRLRNIAGTIKKNGRIILKKYEITSPQFIALQWIQEKGTLTIGELSNKIGLAFSTTTDLIDRLERKVFVKRVQDIKDRRVVHIHILDKGKEIINEVIKQRQDYLGIVLEEFSTEEVIQLNELLYALDKEMNNVDIVNRDQ